MASLNDVLASLPPDQREPYLEYLRSQARLAQYDQSHTLGPLQRFAGNVGVGAVNSLGAVAQLPWVGGEWLREKLGMPPLANRPEWTTKPVIGQPNAEPGTFNTDIPAGGIAGNLGHFGGFLLTLPIGGEGRLAAAGVGKLATGLHLLTPAVTKGTTRFALTRSLLAKGAEGAADMAAVMATRTPGTAEERAEAAKDSLWAGAVLGMAGRARLAGEGRLSYTGSMATRGLIAGAATPGFSPVEITGNPFLDSAAFNSLFLGAKAALGRAPVPAGRDAHTERESQIGADLPGGTKPPSTPAPATPPFNGLATGPQIPPDFYPQRPLFGEEALEAPAPEEAPSRPPRIQMVEPERRMVDTPFGPALEPEPRPNATLYDPLPENIFADEPVKAPRIQLVEPEPTPQPQGDTLPKKAAASLLRGNSQLAPDISEAVRSVASARTSSPSGTNIRQLRDLLFKPGGFTTAAVRGLITRQSGAKPAFFDAAAGILAQRSIRHSFNRIHRGAFPESPLKIILSGKPDPADNIARYATELHTLVVYPSFFAVPPETRIVTSAHELFHGSNYSRIQALGSVGFRTLCERVGLPTFTEWNETEPLRAAERFVEATVPDATQIQVVATDVLPTKDVVFRVSFLDASGTPRTLGVRPEHVTFRSADHSLEDVWVTTLVRPDEPAAIAQLSDFLGLPTFDSDVPLYAWTSPYELISEGALYITRVGETAADNAWPGIVDYVRTLSGGTYGMYVEGLSTRPKRPDHPLFSREQVLGPPVEPVWAAAHEVDLGQLDSLNFGMKVSRVTASGESPSPADRYLFGLDEQGHPQVDQAGNPIESPFERVPTRIARALARKLRAHRVPPDRAEDIREEAAQQFFVVWAELGDKFAPEERYRTAIGQAAYTAEQRLKVELALHGDAPISAEEGAPSHFAVGLGTEMKGGEANLPDELLAAGTKVPIRVGQAEVEVILERFDEKAAAWHVRVPGQERTVRVSAEVILKAMDISIPSRKFEAPSATEKVSASAPTSDSLITLDAARFREQLDEQTLASLDALFADGLKSFKQATQASKGRIADILLRTFGPLYRNSDGSPVFSDPRFTTKLPSGETVPAPVPVATLALELNLKPDSVSKALRRFRLRGGALPDVLSQGRALERPLRQHALFDDVPDHLLSEKLDAAVAGEPADQWVTYIYTKRLRTSQGRKTLPVRAEQGTLSPDGVYTPVTSQERLYHKGDSASLPGALTFFERDASGQTVQKKQHSLFEEHQEVNEKVKREVEAGVVNIRKEQPPPLPPTTEQQVIVRAAEPHTQKGTTQAAIRGQQPAAQREARRPPKPKPGAAPTTPPERPFGEDFLWRDQRQLPLKLGGGRRNKSALQVGELLYDAQLRGQAKIGLHGMTDAEFLALRFADQIRHVATRLAIAARKVGDDYSKALKSYAEKLGKVTLGGKRGVFPVFRAVAEARTNSERMVVIRNSLDALQLDLQIQPETRTHHQHFVITERDSGRQFQVADPGTLALVLDARRRQLKGAPSLMPEGYDFIKVRLPGDGSPPSSPPPPDTNASPGEREPGGQPPTPGGPLIRRFATGSWNSLRAALDAAASAARELKDQEVYAAPLHVLRALKLVKLDASYYIEKLYSIAKQHKLQAGRRHFIGRAAGALDEAAFGVQTALGNEEARRWAALHERPFLEDPAHGLRPNEVNFILAARAWWDKLFRAFGFPEERYVYGYLARWQTPEVNKQFRALNIHSDAYVEFDSNFERHRRKGGGGKEGGEEDTPEGELTREMETDYFKIAEAYARYGFRYKHLATKGASSTLGPLDRLGAVIKRYGDAPAIEPLIRAHNIASGRMDERRMRWLDAKWASIERHRASYLKWSEALSRMDAPLTNSVAKLLKSRYETLGGKLNDRELNTLADYIISANRARVFGLSVMRSMRHVTQSLFFTLPRVGARNYFDALKIMVHPTKSKWAYAKAWREGIISPAFPDEFRASRNRYLRFNDWLTSVYRYGDTWERVLSYTAQYLKTNRALDRYHAHKNIERFMEESGATMLHPSAAAEVRQLVVNGKEVEAKRRHGYLLTQTALFDYQRANAPRRAGGVWGRLLGQYGRWPLGAVETMHQLVRYGTPQQRIDALLAYTASAMAVYSIGQALGVRTGDWIPFAHSAGYSLGPTFTPIEKALDLLGGEPFETDKFLSDWGDDPVAAVLGATAGTFAPAWDVWRTAAADINFSRRERRLLRLGPPTDEWSELLKRAAGFKSTHEAHRHAPILKKIGSIPAQPFRQGIQELLSPPSVVISPESVHVQRPEGD